MLDIVRQACAHRGDTSVANADGQVISVRRNLQIHLHPAVFEYNLHIRLFEITEYDQLKCDLL